MKYFLSGFSALFVFLCVFFVCGWFLMPFLPPVPDRPVSVVEGAYWVDNWVGVLLGGWLGWLAFKSSLRHHNAEEEKASKTNPK